MNRTGTVSSERSLALLAAIGLIALGLSACSDVATPTGSGAAASAALGPFYNVPPELMRPDGTMINGLLPMNPDDQS